MTSIETVGESTARLIVSDVKRRAVLILRDRLTGLAAFTVPERRRDCLAMC